MTGSCCLRRKNRDIYAMDVVEIPTNRPVIRVDHEDAVYMTKKEKFNAVVNAVVEAHETAAVLVGTITIETSELLSRMLKTGIKHNVLNAKFHELEAEIVTGRSGRSSYDRHQHGWSWYRYQAG